MKKVFFLLFFMNAVCLFSQTKDSITDLGKRKNILWEREIDAKNLGNFWYTYYYPIYFKSKENNTWRRAGVFGHRIKPFLEGDAQAMRHFHKYRWKKVTSYAIIPATAYCLGAWTYKSVLLADQGVPYFQAIFKPEPLAYLSLYFGLFTASQYLNTNADFDLLKATHTQKRRSGNRKSISFSLNVEPNPQSLIGLNVQF